jgi:DNA primase catalytic core
MHALEDIVSACQSLLDIPQAQEAKAYLNSRLNPDTQQTFQFGYFPSTQDMSLLTSVINRQTLIDHKLMYRRNVNDSSGFHSYDVSFFESHPLVMPYKDAYGKVIALVGRSLLSDDEREVPKYKNTVFKKARHLFGLNQAKTAILQADCVYVVEGQFDVIKAYERGLHNVVAVGNSNIGIYQVALLMRYTSNIVLLFDGDEAGKIGMERAMMKFGKYTGMKKGVLPSGYKDLDEYLSENTVADFHRLGLGNNLASRNIIGQDDSYRAFSF